MNPMDLISSVLAFLAQIPVVGQWLAVIVSYAVPASVVITALVAVWHSLVLALVAMSQVPGLSGLSGLANTLKTSEDSVEGFINTYVMPVLKQLSLLPLPKQQQQQVAKK